MKKKLLLLVLFAFSIQVSAQTAIQEFNFNGTLSNTNKDISFLGTVKYVKDRTGVVNSAIRVVNTTLEASIGNLPLANSARTVSIWVKYNDITTANYIWGYGSLTNAQYYGLLQQSTTTSKSDLNLAGWGPVNDVIVTTTIASNTWYNYTVTYDGLTSRIYRNGKLIKSSISPRKLTSAVVFGLGRMGAAVSINADIDDLKIYNVALSAEEVSNLYNSSPEVASNDVIVTTTTKATVPKVTSKSDVKSNSTTISKANIVLSTPVETLPAKKTSEIYSSQGLKVLDSNENVLDITTLPEGMYLLKVINTQPSAAKKITEN